jgi:hypothetical protein
LPAAAAPPLSAVSSHPVEYPGDDVQCTGKLQIGRGAVSDDEAVFRWSF